MNKKKDSTVKKRDVTTKKNKKDALKKKRDAENKSEFMAKKRKLDRSVHGGPRQIQPSMLETVREKHISICCTSYNASYTHPNERNCVAVIEQGILWLRKRGSGTQSKEKRSGQRSCGSD
ncbi:unnamed protein product [Brassica rapa]|uniref:Uncharacterized protein n=2 Tax=Brassica TaxID=3705 RepID=A0A3P5Z7L6_BRACM|nr:unnamed protein product [Brassica napus]CAG7876681.1 unnamed protein product [Brassica rapa]CDY10640.1 BnaA05g17220D [Brassica napus]VDC71794.1 unnamed protein product [Brassica rapa]